MKRLSIQLLVLLGLLFGCKKDDTETNPYTLPEFQAPTDSVSVHSPDPNTIAGLHKYVFLPTCANSGCHDGTFEPDFRTIQSSWNTLVMQPVIKNNPQGSFQYRVLPGNPDESVLVERLIHDIDGQSGIMPLWLEPTSDWPEKKNQYIQNVRNWILNGAPDVYGNTTASQNLPPRLNGIFIALPGSTEPLPRAISTGAIVVPPGTASVDIYVALEDDITPVDQLAYLKLKTGATLNGFATLPELSLQTVPALSGPAYNGGNTIFRHKTTVSLAGLPLFQQQFVRVYVQDSSPEITEIPGVNSAPHVRAFYSFQLGEQ
jgi:hypothetical protein